MQISISIVRLISPVIIAYLYFRNRSVSVRGKKRSFVKSILARQTDPVIVEELKWDTFVKEKDTQ